METQGRKPAIALSHDELNRMIAFIRSYAEVHAILLLGQFPGLKEYEKTKLLRSFILSMRSPVRPCQLELVLKLISGAVALLSTLHT